MTSIISYSVTINNGHILYDVVIFKLNILVVIDNYINIGYYNYMRVRFIKNHKNYKIGDIAEVTPNVGFGLVDCGFAIVSKEIVGSEIKQKSLKQKRV